MRAGAAAGSVGPVRRDLQCPDNVRHVDEGLPDLFRGEVASALRRYPEID